MEKNKKWLQVFQKNHLDLEVDLFVSQRSLFQVDIQKNILGSSVHDGFGRLVGEAYVRSQP